MRALMRNAEGRQMGVAQFCSSFGVALVVISPPSRLYLPGKLLPNRTTRRWSATLFTAWTGAWFVPPSLSRCRFQNERDFFSFCCNPYSCIAVAGQRKSHPKEWLFPDNANKARSCSVARRSPVNLHLSHAAAHTIESGG